MGKLNLNGEIIETVDAAKNPFDDDSVTNVTSENQEFNHLKEELHNNAQNPHLNGNIDKRAQILIKMSEDLQIREKKVAERETDLNSSEFKRPENNWPIKLYAVDFHDIENEIPQDRQRLCMQAYRLWMGVSFGLIWNIVTLITAAIVTTNVVSHPMERVLWALIYMLLGVAGSWAGWYKGLYNALKTDKNISWLRFWIVFGVHFLFVIYSIVGLPNWATSGVFNMLAQIGPNGSWTVFAFCVFNIALWTFIGLLSLVVSRSALSIYKSSGHSTETLRQDARSTVISQLIQTL